MNIITPKLVKAGLWIMIQAMIIVACNPTETGTSTPSLVATFTASVATVTPTRTSTPTLTLAPTLIPSPLPTLSSEQAEAFVRELLQTNGNCELPCWWGIAPGSNWDYTLEYLNTFALEILSFPKGNRNVVYWVSFPIPKDAIAADQLAANFYVYDHSIELIIAPGIKGKVIDILTTYGSPAEVWIYFSGEWPGGYTYYTIALSYPDKGIAFVYGGEGRSVNHNNRKYLTMCAGDLGIAPELWLFSSQSPVSFNNLASKWSPSSFGFGKLDQVTDLHEEAFFELFSTDPEACFETPYDLWPIYLTPESP